ncbi:MAG: hypothetical protein SWH54_08405 [Thermodesulfobacteriota bacterium]|nr:hypothetical protein [Thermodesulfobacteriota bacterium]
MSKNDFTLSVYQNLLEEIRRSGFEVITIKEYFVKKDNEESFIILRHDVDRCPENALKMAELESALGMYATYYFRFKKKAFVPHIIKQIKDLGHEIGYHYEVMDKARGNIFQAEQIFNSELTSLRKLAEVNTVCMHGNPLTKWDNRSFWKHFSYSKFSLLGEAYLSITDPDLYYSTDTGRGWNRLKYNMKDIFSCHSISYLPTLTTTWQLIDVIRSKKYKKIYLQIHPNRWSWKWLQWHIQMVEDIAANLTKVLINFYRRAK